MAKGLKPFEYEPAEIPLYTPGARWGTLGEPIRKMQKPLSPEESRKHLALPGGFEAKLFVAEPQIFKPITMTWDHLGRLYVAETVDYPNEMQPKGKGRDRISIVEDTDGDGKADKVSLFADNLSIPTSLLYVNGGLVVTQAPDMLFLKDTDGDGKADERKVLFTGFGTRDTHAGPSNLRYGLDNWIYAIIGYSGFNGEVGGERHNFRQGFFRFKPDGSKLEFLRSTNNNSWGVGIQRRRPAVRVDRQRLPQRLHADPEPLLRVGPRHGALGPAEHRRLEPLLPDHRERPAGRLARRLHRRGRARHSTRLAPTRSSTGTRRPSSRSRPGTSSRRSRSTRTARISARTTPGTSSPATTSGPRRSWPRSAPTGRSG